MKMNKLFYVGMALSLGAVLTACGGDKKDTADKGDGKAKQEFTYVETQEMPTADPSLSTDAVSGLMLYNCYEGLYRRGDKNEIIPAGAEEMAKVSDDGKLYTFKLRKDAKWSNGDPVTAKDYVYSWQRTVDPATKSEYAYLFEPIENAKDIQNGAKDKSELGAKAVDDYTLEVKLTKPVAYFDQLMAFANFVPQNQKIVEKSGAEYAKTSETAVFNGPFKLTEFDGPGSDTNWAFKKNGEYWDKKKVKLDKINFTVVKDSSTALNLFQDGQAEDVTLSGELAQQMKDDPQRTVEMKASTFYFEFNRTKEDSPFKNENLRKAISYSIDRDAYVEKILANGSKAPKSFIPAGTMYDPKSGKDFAKEVDTELVYDKKKAKEYWEKAQKELGIKTLKFDILTDDSEGAKKSVEFFQGQIEDAMPGVTVTASTVPFTVRLDRSNNGDFDVVTTGWNADYSDPSNFLELLTTGNAYNRGKYSDPKFDELVNKAQNADATDPEARWKDMIEAENQLMSGYNVVPTYQKAETHMRSSKLKNVQVFPTGARYDYKEAYMAE